MHIVLYYAHAALYFKYVNKTLTSHGVGFCALFGNVLMVF